MKCVRRVFLPNNRLCYRIFSHYTIKGFRLLDFSSFHFQERIDIMQWKFTTPQTHFEKNGSQNIQTYGRRFFSCVAKQSFVTSIFSFSLFSLYVVGFCYTILSCLSSGWYVFLLIILFSGDMKSFRC